MSRKISCWLITAVLLSGCLLSAAGIDDFISIPDVHVIVDSSATGVGKINQESFHRALQGAGFDVQEEPLSPDGLLPGSRNLVVVIPSAAARKLNPDRVQSIMALVKSGAVLITDTPTPLSKAFGIRTTPGKTRVSGVISWCRKSQVLRWADRPEVPFIIAPSRALVLYRTRAGNRLAVQLRVGSGAVVFFAALFDPLSGYGYSRFPDMAQILAQLKIVSPFSRQGVDAYFDAGYRYDQKIETLAERWRQWGIRAVRANLWNLHDDRRYFEYRDLVAAAHKNGVLLYGWVQWPYAGIGFWQKHPEWRQKNGYLHDAVMGFLYLMDFQIEDCLNAVLHDARTVLADHFDGLDIAEFSVTGGVDEALEGPASPKNFVSFGDPARAEFRKKTGVDSIELLNPSSPHFWKKDPALLKEFYSSRREANRRLTETVMSNLSSFNRDLGQRLDLVMTVIDNSHNPEFDQLYGTDLPFILDRVKAHGFTLQVEDPTPEWAKPPDRYRKLGETYRALIGDRPFDIDINFEDNHPDGQVGFPAQVPIGSELHWLWHFAHGPARNVCFYSEYHIQDVDWALMPAVMAAGSKIRRDEDGWTVDAPHTVFLEVQSDQPVALDGNPWHCRDGRRILIPPGSHHLALLSSQETALAGGLYLISTTAELRESKRSDNSFVVDLESGQRSLSRFRGAVDSVAIDGKEVAPERSSGDVWLLFVEPGRHRITAVPSPNRGDSGMSTQPHFPMQNSVLSLRRKRWPLEMAGEAMRRSPRSLRASTFGSRPARNTKTSPVSLAR